MVDYVHRRIWWGAEGGHRPPLEFQIDTYSKKGGLFGQKSLFIVLKWVIRALFAIANPPRERIQMRL